MDSFGIGFWLMFVGTFLGVLSLLIWLMESWGTVR